MPHSEILAIAVLIGLVAFLYSSVGHGGASGYIAVFTLLGYEAGAIRPTALVLNLIVSSIGFVQFWRAGHFTWQRFWPFALLSIPMSFFAGSLSVPTRILNPLLGLVLLVSAVRLLFPLKEPVAPSPPAKVTAMATGAGIGLLSGLTGTGGGIFLTPLLLLFRWSNVKQAAATSAGFILVNSTAGLLGHLSTGRSIPAIAWWLAVVAVMGGAGGSYLGSRKLPTRSIEMLLIVVLVIAGQKLLIVR